jgi:hypothetical protein
MYFYIFLEQKTKNIAGVPGLEPRQAEPESAGLPITPYPKVKAVSAKDTLLNRCLYSGKRWLVA